MANKIAVAVIHGMGSQGEDSQGLNDISFSAGLYTRLRGHLGDSFMDRVGWREIFWADILQNRQEKFVEESLIQKGARWMNMRRFVLHNLADAASYRLPVYSNDITYFLIHERVHRTIQRLAQITDENTPLIVLAHSLGGHIMSNYIYDMTVGTPQLPGSSDFQRLKTMAGFVTFGCNIPVFAFSVKPEHIIPIEFPGQNIDPGKRLAPWWLNLNDKDDVLGMPLGGLSPGYRGLEAAGELRDEWIRAGGLLNSWNPLSHSQYWTSRQFYEPVADVLEQAMAIGPVV